MAITDKFCPPNYEDNQSFPGTDFACIVLTVLMEIILFVYVYYQTCYGVAKSGQSISKSLTRILQCYHLFVLLYLIGQLFPYVTGMTNNTDLSTPTSCFADIYLVIPAGIFYIFFILFWLVRLNIVFSGTIYKVTLYQNCSVLMICIIAGLTGEILLFIAMFEAIFTRNKNQLFCFESLYNVDFFPSLNKSWFNIEYPFYHCKSTSKARFIATMCAAVSVPLMNIMISYLYLRKMYLLFHSLVEIPDKAAAKMSGIEFELNIDIAGETTQTRLQTPTKNTENGKETLPRFDSLHSKTSSITERMSKVTQIAKSTKNVCV